MKFVLLVAAVMGLGGALSFIYAKVRPNHLDRGLLNQPALPLLLVLAFFCSLVFVAPYFSVRKALRNPNIQQGSKYLFSDEDIRIESANGSSILKWGAFARARETNGSFILFFNNNFAHLIPKRCFTDPDQILLFRQLLRECLPNKLKLQR